MPFLRPEADFAYSTPRRPSPFLGFEPNVAMRSACGSSARCEDASDLARGQEIHSCDAGAGGRISPTGGDFPAGSCCVFTKSLHRGNYSEQAGRFPPAAGGIGDDAEGNGAMRFSYGEARRDGARARGPACAPAFGTRAAVVVH
jgi:hypothetical protein